MEFKIQEEDVRNRIDLFLSEKFNISRSKIKKLIESNLILVNNKNIKSSYKLEINDKILIKSLDIEENVEVIPVKKHLDIVYEDKDIAVVNKERGVMVHLVKGDEEDTLVNYLVYKYKNNLSNLNDSKRPGIVHRIDKDTSGLLVVAKTNEAYKGLILQFKSHSIKREYTFICHGNIFENIVIEKNLIRSKFNRFKFETSLTEGKYGYTKIIPLENFENINSNLLSGREFTYGKAILKTGRTHQIRCHLSSVNHEIVGDSLYSNYIEKIKGQLLHGKVLGFSHPITGKYMEFEKEEPEVFLNVLKILRNGQ